MNADVSWPPSQSLLSGRPSATTATSTAIAAPIVRTGLVRRCDDAATGAGFDLANKGAAATGCGAWAAGAASTTGTSGAAGARTAMTAGAGSAGIELTTGATSGSAERALITGASSGSATTGSTGGAATAIGSDTGGESSTE